jgi:hypothetical protein
MSSPDTPADRGLRQGLTSYGDREFSLFLRKAFIKGAGYTDSALDRPVVGITGTGSACNPCHGNMPQLLEAVQRGVMLTGSHRHHRVGACTDCRRQQPAGGQRGHRLGDGHGQHHGLHRRSAGHHRAWRRQPAVRHRRAPPRG